MYMSTIGVIVTMRAEKESGGMMGSRGLKNICLTARYRVQYCYAEWTFAIGSLILPPISLSMSVVRGIGSPGYKKTVKSPLHVLLFSSSASLTPTSNTAIDLNLQSTTTSSNTYIVITHSSSNMSPDTANTEFAATGQTLPSQPHIPSNLAMTDVATLAEFGQTLPPQTHNFIDPAKTDVSALAEVDAGCVGRVCSQGSISQAPSAPATSKFGQSYPTSQFI